MDAKDNLTLYGITDEMIALDEILEKDSGEVSEEFEQLESQLIPLLQSKVDSTCGYVQKLKDLITSAKEQKQRLDIFVKQKQNKIDNLGNYVQFCLEKTGQKSFMGDLYEMKVRKPSKVLLIDELAEVPIEFIEIVKSTKVDKKGLKKAVESGSVEVQGISIIEGKKSVSFKLRTESKKEKPVEHESVASNS